MLRLTGRRYNTRPLTEMRQVAEPVELDPARTALVVMHCWDIGCEGGPEIDPRYFVGMGSYEAFAEADRVIRECIRPAMDAARAAGAHVCAVEPESIARLHPEAQEDLDPPSPGGPPAPPPAVPGWRERVTALFHGEAYATESPYARMDRVASVAPLPGEIYAWQTGQLDRLLRRRGVENLVYCGFATDMCVLRAPGGVEPMAPLGYRLFLLRDATVGVEFPDTFEERLATRWGLRYFETHYGQTFTTGEFIAACGP
ncbi:MAG: isochorismatase family protein [Armatimonadetes bacterium]|nr:isochorismatase family protein [Armatimonadota bacterium]